MAIDAVAPNQNRSWRFYIHWVALATICLVPILLYLPLLASPFNADEGFYATVARIILHGGAPYRDAFDSKPPMVFVWYAASFLLFGEHVWAPRLLVALLLALTTGLVYVEGRLIFSRSGGLIAASAFALSIGIAKFETNAQTEYFMLLPMVAGLVAFTLARTNGDPRWYLLSGVLNALAIVTRQTAIFAFAAILVCAVTAPATPRRRPSQSRGGPVSAMLAGAAAVGLIVGLTFVVVGAGSDLWDAVIVYGWQYSNYTPLYVKLIGLFTSLPLLAFVAGPWMLLAGVGVAYTIRNDRRHETLLLVGWLLANVFGVASGGRYYHHYYVQLLPAFALLAPSGVAFVKTRWDLRRNRLLFYPLIVFPLLTAFALNGGVFIKSSLSARHIAIYPTAERTQWETESPDLAEYIRVHTTEDDFVFNLGYQSELYFYADRRPASRYMFDRLYDVDPSLESKTVADLVLRRPTMIVDSARYETQREGYPSPLIRAFIRDNYTYVGKVDYADVYILRN